MRVQLDPSVELPPVFVRAARRLRDKHRVTTRPLNVAEFPDTVSVFASQWASRPVAWLMYWTWPLTPVELARSTGDFVYVIEHEFLTFDRDAIVMKIQCCASKTVIVDPGFITFEQQPVRFAREILAP